jgi:hypothetical protein
MTISGSSPVGPAGAIRAARAYGLPPRASAAGAAPAREAGANALHAVLTAEERAYFDQLAQLGPISYAPARRSAETADAPRGLRLDVTG